MVMKKCFIVLLMVVSLISMAATRTPPIPPTPKKSPSPAITNSSPPIIKSAPVSKIVTQGTNVKLSVIAQNPKKNDKVLKYQWSKNSKPIVGATNNTLIIPMVQYANRGVYDVAVSNSTGGTNTVSTLTVTSTNILSACYSTNALIALAWDYNFTNNPTVNGFRIYYGTENSNYTTIIPVSGQVLSTTISNLSNGKTYYIVATAFTTNGMESVYSSQVIPTIGFACGIPFTIDIMMLTNNVPRLTTQVCPGCVLLVQRTLSLFPTSWVKLGTTTADQYGNIIYDDITATNNMAFYKMTVP